MPTSAPGSSRRSAGFTLVEVLVALGIVAIALVAGLQATAALTNNARRQSDVLLAQMCAENELIRMRLARQMPQIFYFRADAWTNPQSSAAQAASGLTPATEAGATGGRAAGALPEGVRLVLVLPPGRAIAGQLMRDWVRPTVGGGKG